MRYALALVLAMVIGAAMIQGAFATPQTANSTMIAQYDGPSDSGSVAGPGPWFHQPVDHDRN